MRLGARKWVVIVEDGDVGIVVLVYRHQCRRVGNGHIGDRKRKTRGTILSDRSISTILVWLTVGNRSLVKAVLVLFTLRDMGRPEGSQAAAQREAVDSEGVV